MTPAPPHPSGPDLGLHPELGLDPDLGLDPAEPVVAPGPGPAFPVPRLPGTVGEPAGIITCRARPRRWRRRRQAVPAAVLATVLAATVWAGLLIWHASPAPSGPAAARPSGPAAARPPGRARPLHPNAVIHMARARQHRRRQRIAQAAADTITAAGGGGAAARLHLRGRPGTRQPGPGPAGLTGINILGGGCATGYGTIASDSRHVWVSCPGGLMFELDAATGTRVHVLTEPTYLVHYAAIYTAVATDGRHVWVTNDPGDGGGSVTELDATTGTLIRVLTGSRYKFRVPTAITTDGAHVWVTNGNSDSVTEFPASS
jgi:hypothetical protein